MFRRLEKLEKLFNAMGYSFTCCEKVIFANGVVTSHTFNFNFKNGFIVEVTEDEIIIYNNAGEICYSFEFETQFYITTYRLGTVLENLCWDAKLMKKIDI